VLSDVVGKLKKMQSPDLSKLRGEEFADGSSMPALTLDVDDAYPADEPVVLRARWNGPEHAGVAVTAEVAGRPPVPMVPAEQGWRLELADLTAGVHRVTITAQGPGTAGALPVQDLFEAGAR
jgi:hypothetical protein